MEMLQEADPKNYMYYESCLYSLLMYNKTWWIYTLVSGGLLLGIDILYYLDYINIHLYIPITIVLGISFGVFLYFLIDSYKMIWKLKEYYGKL